MFKKRYLTLLPAILGVLLMASSVEASNKTLPKGVFSFQTEHSNFEWRKVAIKTDSGKRKFISKDEFTADKISTLKPFIGVNVVGIGTLIDADQKLVDSYIQNNTKFQLAYGLSKSFTVFAEVSHVYKRLVYNDGYIAAVKRIDTVANLQGNDVFVPPKEGKADALGDTYLGFKWRTSERTGIAFKFTNTFLKTGRDSYYTTNRKADGVEEFKTGEAHDTYTLALFYSPQLFKKTIHLKAALDYYTPGGYENVLDNKDQVVDWGERVSLVAATDFKLTRTLTLGTEFTYQRAFTDRKKENGEWVKISDSDTQLLLAEVNLHYRPFVFLDTWVGYIFPVAHEPTAGVYEFPGRLDPSNILQFGTTVYFKLF